MNKSLGRKNPKLMLDKMKQNRDKETSHLLYGYYSKEASPLYGGVSQRWPEGDGLGRADGFAYGTKGREVQGQGFTVCTPNLEESLLG